MSRWPCDDNALGPGSRPSMTPPAREAPLGQTLELARPAARRVALACLLGAAAIGAGIGLIATSAWLISRASQRPQESALAIAIVGVQFFALSRGLFRYAHRVVTHDVAFRALADLRVRCYARLEALAPAGLPAFRSGDLLARVVHDVDSLQDLLIRVIPPFATAVLVGTVTVALMWLILPAAGLILLVALALGATALTWLTGRLARKAEARQACRPLRAHRRRRRPDAGRSGADGPRRDGCPTPAHGRARRPAQRPRRGIGSDGRSGPGLRDAAVGPVDVGRPRGRSRRRPCRHARRRAARDDRAGSARGVRAADRSPDRGPGAEARAPGRGPDLCGDRRRPAGRRSRQTGAGPVAGGRAAGAWAAVPLFGYRRPGCSTGSTSTSLPAARSRSSAAAAPASRRSPKPWCGFSPTRVDRSNSTASRSAI